MAAEGAVSATGRASADLPYPRSWIDHLIHAVERLPIPAWASYGSFLVGVVLVINALNWIGERYPPGTFDPGQSGYAVYGVFMLALVHYLNEVARSKIEAFRPALDLSEQEYQRLRYELTTLPAREGALAEPGGARVRRIPVRVGTARRRHRPGLPGVPGRQIPHRGAHVRALRRADLPHDPSVTPGQPHPCAGVADRPVRAFAAVCVFVPDGAHGHRPRGAYGLFVPDRSLDQRTRRRPDGLGYGRRSDRIRPAARGHAPPDRG